MKREVRTFSGAQLRAKADDKPGASGYAAVFNQVTDLGWFRETIKPGAFSRALSEKQDVRCLMNHDANIVLGRTRSKTLTLAEDSKGLQFDCDFPATQAATDLRASLERGDIDQCSFGFMVTKQTWTDEKMDDGTIVQTRTIEDVDLLDVSIVTYPAYEGTSAEARSKVLFPDGIPEEVRSHQRNAKCQCDCDECKDGNCADCTDPECEDENCRCMDRNRHAGEHRDKKTKKIDGVDLASDCFAYVGDESDTSTWKLPIKFPGDDDKTKTHIRNAIARFNQTKGIPDDKKDGVWKKIVAAAKEHDIDVSEEKAKKWNLTDAQFRDFRAADPKDPDGDDDDDTEILDAINTASRACEDCSDALDAAADKYDEESLAAASTECKKAIAVLEKAVAAIEKEQNEGDDDSERMKMRARVVAASL